MKIKFSGILIDDINEHEEKADLQIDIKLAGSETVSKLGNPLNVKYPIDVIFSLTIIFLIAFLLEYHGIDVTDE